MFDLISYILGKKAGEQDVVLSGDSNYTFTDENTDGNIEITESEVSNNG